MNLAKIERLVTEPSGMGGPVSISIMAALAALLVLAEIKKIRGTTLVAASLWLMLALLAVATAEWIIALSRTLTEPSWAGALRYCAAVLSLCPVMAILGAKRPQDRSWHWVVGSLWLILQLPSGHGLLFRPGESLVVHPAVSWFLLGLIAIGLLNTIATRYWHVGLLIAAAQSVLLNGALPLPLAELSGKGPCYGVALLLAALALRAFVDLRSASAAAGSSGERLDRVWLDFRDRYGAFWALRVRARFNSAASDNHWDISLEWDRLTIRRKSQTELSTQEPSTFSDLSPQTQQAVLRSLRGSLRRFVSPEWLSLLAARRKK